MTALLFCSAAIQFSQVWLMYVGWGGFMGVGLSFIYIPSTSNTVKWFKLKGIKGLGMGVYQGTLPP